MLAIVLYWRPIVLNYIYTFM